MMNVLGRMFMNTLAAGPKTPSTTTPELTYIPLFEAACFNIASWYYHILQSLTKQAPTAIATFNRNTQFRAHQANPSFIGNCTACYFTTFHACASVHREAH